MPSNIFSQLATLMNRVVDIISQGSLERVRVLRDFNRVFRDSFLSGEIERHCTVTTGPGNPAYRHELSTFHLRSGFKITIENDSNLTDQDYVEISRYVLESAPFVRQLMALGYDTLIIKGRNRFNGVQIELKKISDLHRYMLGQ